MLMLTNVSYRYESPGYEKVLLVRAIGDRNLLSATIILSQCKTFLEQ